MSRQFELDLARCRATLRGGSRTFYCASFLLPRAVRGPATALYAFCRLADDAIDGGGGRVALAALEQRLERVYAGRPAAHAVERAFSAVVERYELPRALPQALLEGLAWDAAGRRYDTLSELYAYAARVAGTVGAMMAVLMNARTPALLARATDLGVAMQLSNIARDVGEDVRAGRLYLPRAWLAEAGIDAGEWLAAPVHTRALGSVVARVVAAADALYRRADAGIGGLPAGCRYGIHAARLLYAEIGHEVARHGHDALSARAVVGAGRKAELLVAAGLRALLMTGDAAAPPLAETRFLVEAALQPAPRAPQAAAAAGGLLAVIALFDRLERRDRAARPLRIT